MYAFDSATLSCVPAIQPLAARGMISQPNFHFHFQNYTVDQLKRWLKCRGLKLSGKRSDLIARVKNCLSSGDHHVLVLMMENGWKPKFYEKKTGDDAKKQNLRKIPDIPKSGWKKFPAYELPSQFNYGHVHYYGLESLPSSNEKENDDNENDGLGHMTDKPFKNGRKYVDSGFVHDIKDNKNDDYYFLRLAFYAK